MNKQGQFNVPIGTKSAVCLDTDDFEHVSSALRRNCRLICADFEKVIGLAQSGDLIFVDPPYTVAHKNNGFVKYNENLFTWNDQIRLRNSLDLAHSRGVSFIVTNASHASLAELYKNYEVEYVSRSSVIAGASSARGAYEELVITNY